MHCPAKPFRLYLRRMIEMQPINLSSFRKKAAVKKRSFRRFLTRLEKNPPPGLDKKIVQLEKEVWQETDCLSCANCCKTMTPTFTKQDMKRISAHFGQTVEEFQTKWLKKERGGDILASLTVTYNFGNTKLKFEQHNKGNEAEKNRLKKN